MSQRNIWIAVVVIVVLGLAVWAYSAYAPAQQGTAGDMASTTNSTASSTTSTGGNTSTTSSGGTTLGRVLTQGGNYTCTIESITNAQHSTGVVYGSGGKTRLDVTVDSSGTTVTSHIIRSGGYSYTWVDGQTTGVKTAVSTGTGAQQPGQGGYIEFGDDTNVSSTCHAWLPDVSQFVPPKGISFVAR